MSREDRVGGWGGLEWEGQSKEWSQPQRVGMKKSHQMEGMKQEDSGTGGGSFMQFLTSHLLAADHTTAYPLCGNPETDDFWG